MGTELGGTNRNLPGNIILIFHQIGEIEIEKILVHTSKLKFCIRFYGFKYPTKGFRGEVLYFFL